MKWTLLAVVAVTGALILCAGITPGSAHWLDRSTSNLVCAVASEVQESDYAALLKDAKLSLAEGVEKGLAEAKEGIVVRAELEGDKTTHWAIDVSKGDKVLAVDIDVKTGRVVGSDLENEDQSKLAKSAKVTIQKAIEIALKKIPGQAVGAELRLAAEKPQFDVRILAKDKVKSVKIDALSGEIAGKQAKAKKEPVVKIFTDSFAVEAGDWASTGRNTYWILEPGYFQILEGKEDGKDVRITITVLNETRKIDGVETRVVEEKLFESGQIKEITRDYFAFSKKTASVYYFGEDVDNYKDGKVENHGGSWISGENGAKYGLIMPGINLLGARYCQEVAPGVGMDRAENVALNETVETPSGRYEHCLKTEETTPLEPATKEYKLYAPGVGIVQEGEAKLVKYGMATTK
jgi:uncharacterized membrane protein YkoI